MELSKARILVAEDNLALRKEIQYAFDHNRVYADMKTVRNGQEALDEIQRSDYDLVVLDWDMPEMDGETALAEIRKLRPDIKAIFHTGSDYDYGFASRLEGKKLANKHQVPVMLKSHLTWNILVAVINLTLEEVYLILPD